MFIHRRNLMISTVPFPTVHSIVKIPIKNIAAKIILQTGTPSVIYTNLSTYTPIVSVASLCNSVCTCC